MSSGRSSAAPTRPAIWQILEYLHSEECGMARALAIYADLHKDPGFDDEAMATLAEWDRFYLGVVICGRSDLKHPWIYERTREVEANPDGYLDIWAREHYKSTIITFLGVLQEIIHDPEITIGIFSHDRPVAKSFLFQIKQELEGNRLFYNLWPHIFWQFPKKQSPRWSLDEGIIVKRKTNPKEATVEAHGLVDSMPTGAHFRLMVYDDVVTEKSVSSPDMIIKTTVAWELSRNLSAVDSSGLSISGERRTWTVGTRYNYGDTYQVMLNRKVFIPRVYPATDTGTVAGNPVLFTKEDWDRKVRESSEFTIACQLLCNPIAGTQQEFHPEWIRLYEVRPENINVAIICDPANSKKRGSCNTAMVVIGVDARSNKYLLDGACHKMSLSERWEMLSYLYYKWANMKGVQSVTVGYEKYGMQCDLEHFELMMRLQNKYFQIYPVSWVNDRSGELASQKKDDRIRRLIPDHKNWRFYYPYEGKETKLQAKARQEHKGHLVSAPIIRRDDSGKVYNLMTYFLQNEYLFFPATTSKDMLDAMSRIYDLDIQPAAMYNKEDIMPPYYGEP